VTLILEQELFSTANQRAGVLGDERLVAFARQRNVFGVSFSRSEKHGIGSEPRKCELPEVGESGNAERGELVVNARRVNRYRR